MSNRANRVLQNLDSNNWLLKNDPNHKTTRAEEMEHQLKCEIERELETVKAQRDELLEVAELFRTNLRHWLVFPEPLYAEKVLDLTSKVDAAIANAKGDHE